MATDSRNAATRLFAIPELLELILLSLPRDTTYDEINTTRFILRARTTSRTWHELIHASTPLRQVLYLSNLISTESSSTWTHDSPFPPAQPNPWIPFLLLNQRSWGSAYPFDTGPSNPRPPSSDDRSQTSQPRDWTFTLEFSRAQWSRFPPARAGGWRDMLAAEPPFRAFWYTRAAYELGSGRAPFVMHLDYNGWVRKARQEYRRGRREGVTLGMVVDAVDELFEKDREARYVMVESLAVSSTGGRDDERDLSQDRPMTRSCVPGSTAEKRHGWVLGL